MSSIFWDIRNALSYGALFNFIIGNRGGGKSYGCKKFVIEQFKNHGHQFVYLRRYVKEFKKIKTWFNDISKQFPDDKFEVKGMEFYINDKLAGYAMPLSTSKIDKSNSFPDVKTIIFDEFLIDKGVHRYLTDEVILFLECYETIARMRDVRVFFLSNAISITNPYFLYFDLTLPKNKKNSIIKNDMLVQLVMKDEFINEKKKTRFGKIINGTTYGSYSIDNTFLRDTNDFIIKTPSNLRYFFTMKSKGVCYGVWFVEGEGKIFVSSKYDPSYKLIFTTMLDNHQPNIMLLKGSNKSPLFKTFVDAFKMGFVHYDSINTKNVILETIKNTL